MHFQISQVYQFAQHEGKFLTTHQSVLHTLLVSSILFVINVHIGGFRGGAEGATAPPFFLVFPTCCTILLWISFYEVFLILSSETLTLLYFASQILYAACPEKWRFQSGWRRVGGLVPSFWIFWICPWFTIIYLLRSMFVNHSQEAWLIPINVAYN